MRLFASLVGLLIILGCYSCSAQEVITNSNQIMNPIADATGTQEDAINQLKAGGDIEQYELVGVHLDDSFKKAKRVLKKGAIKSQDHSVGNPPMQYTWTFTTSQYKASIYSTFNPKQQQNETPVSSVTLEASVIDYSPQTVRKLYDSYKEQFSQKYGHNRPEKHDLGSIVIYQWNWDINGNNVEIEYQQQDGLPYSTQVKIEKQL